MILHLYFARRFLWTFLSVFFIFVAILGLIDLVEELEDFPELAFGDVLEIVLLNLPHANYEILPLIMILSSVALFVRLTRSSELVVVRAAGRSALGTLIAPLTVAAMLGILSATMFNPIVAASAKRYHDLVNSYRGFGSSVLAISVEGLWLRQATESGQMVIHAISASSDLSVLYDATLVSFSPEGDPVKRITASTATLGDGVWELENVKQWELKPGSNPEAAAISRPTMTLPSTLTRARIIDSFGKPEFIPIWDLPRFIRQLERAGFSARRYAMWFQMELARPLFLTALVLVSAAFTTRASRMGHSGIAILSAVMLGFSLHYIRNFAQIMGENGQIPILLAAWAPPVASFLLALGILLHMEDG